MVRLCAAHLRVHPVLVPRCSVTFCLLKKRGGNCFVDGYVLKKAVVPLCVGWWPAHDFNMPCPCSLVFQDEIAVNKWWRLFELVARRVPLIVFGRFWSWEFLAKQQLHHSFWVPEHSSYFLPQIKAAIPKVRGREQEAPPESQCVYPQKFYTQISLQKVPGRQVVG